MTDDVAALAAALARNRRWAVFPCREDKRPATLSGFKDAVSDPSAVADLWRRYPGPLIGIATGEASGIDVLDIDMKHGEALHWWQDNQATVPPTRTFRTRSGGLHLYFGHASGIGCSAGRLALGVDTRGDGGYVVYWFAAGRECLDNTAPQPWPAWLLTALLPKSKPAPLIRPMSPERADRAIDGIVRAVQDAPEGQRNAVLHWAACRLAERVQGAQIGSGEALALLVAAGAGIGLTEAEARATARSGLARAS
jgi:hypothetical protein